MANVATLFVDPAGNYTGGYTSEEVNPIFAASTTNITRGIIQANVEPNGTVSLEMRVSRDARWFEIAHYTGDFIEEVVLGNHMRVIVTGAARVWLGETR